MLAPMSALAKRIKTLRTAKGITQSALSRLTGIDQSEISRIENGTRRVSTDDLAVIAKHLGVSPAHLIGNGDAARGLSPIIREFVAKGSAPGGLIALAEETSLVDALQVTDREFQILASVDLPPDVDRDGYVQLLMTIRAITKS
ncbi:MAG: XRE family transcriptional regulator [Thioalkalivibrio sp.]|jgi:transcriptional regulator with XRE-family HTH domain|nr:MAG: XRE family transcriptional regulator [Thioalkalivibrio sp.]